MGAFAFAQGAMPYSGHIYIQNSISVAILAQATARDSRFDLQKAAEEATLSLRTQLRLDRRTPWIVFSQDPGRVASPGGEGEVEQLSPGGRGDTPQPMERSL